MAGHHCGRPPRNKGLRYPADPPTVEEVVAIMRCAGSSPDGLRTRALIVLLLRAGLRSETLERDTVDLVRYGTWPTLDEGTGPRTLHGGIRAFVRDTDRARLQAILMTPRPPLLLAMDTEREHARTNLSDAFGPAIARRILRRDTA